MTYLMTKRSSLKPQDSLRPVLKNSFRQSRTSFHEGDDPETNAFYKNIQSRVRSRIERLFAWQKSFRMLYSTDKNLKVIGAASKIVCALQHWALRCELPKYEPLLPVNPSRIHDLFRDAEECDCGFSTDSEDQEACRVVRKKAFESLVLCDFQLPPGKKNI